MNIRTAARDREWGVAATVDGLPSPEPCFELHDDSFAPRASRCARISLLEPRYLPYGGPAAPWALDAGELERLVAFLSRRTGDVLLPRNWERLVAAWNVEAGFIDDTAEAADLVPGATPLPLCTTMPNYLLLR